MRYTYYVFPDNMPIRERVSIYERMIEGNDIEIPSDIPDDILEKNYPQTIDCSITLAKKLLKKFGGKAYTEHCERDGGIFEVTPIVLKGNNSRFKYNRHL